MSSELKSFFSKTRELIETALALRVTEDERTQYAGTGYFDSGVSNRRPTQVAIALALLFHAVLFVIYFPSFGNRVFRPTEQVLVLKNLAPAGGGQPKLAQPKVTPVVPPKPQPILVPIPDPTPHDPEPLRRAEVLEVQPIVNEITAELAIGDIDAPPGPPGRGQGVAGTGTGPGTGPGMGEGAPGTGIYAMGTPGIVDPQILVQTIPSYTDEAIKAKVQGVVLLQAIIRKNGKVDSPVVLRGLGYGLEEKAIREIVSNWRFRPATLNGTPVDLQATIEVTFNLR
jgi:periplasmic protein TonB